MAITIIQEPAIYSPVYNGLVFTASSTETAQLDFFFIFDIYVGGVFVSRHRVAADPTNGHGKFDAGIIVESYISHNIDQSIISFYPNANSYKKVQVNVRELYGAGMSPGEWSSNIYAYNASFDFLDFVSYDSTVYGFGSTGVTKEFLTNAPLTQDVRTGNKLWLYSFTSGLTTNYFKIIVKKYNSLGVLLSTDDIANPYTAATDDNKFLRIGVGPWNITEALGANYLDNAAYYTIQATDNTGATLSELRRFDIDTECSKYEVIRLQFLNKLGGFDAFNFTKLSRATSSIERTSYKKGIGTFNADGTFTYVRSNRAVNTMTVSVKDKLSINSDWITEAESIWLKELLTSPVIFQEITTGHIIPVQIIETSYEKKTSVNDKLFNLKLELEYGYENVRQRY